MENRFGHILKEFEYKWVNSVREMVRKMERELEASEDSPLRDCQSAFWVTPSSGSSGSGSSGKRTATPSEEDDEENSENIPPKLQSPSSTPENQQRCQLLKNLGLGLEKKRKLATVLSYLESQTKAVKRLKDGQAPGKNRPYTATPTLTPTQCFSTRRVLNFGESEYENSQPSLVVYQDPEVVETYEQRRDKKGLQEYHAQNRQEGQGSQATRDADEAVSFAAENILDQLRRNRSNILPAGNNSFSQRRFQFPTRQRGSRQMLFTDLSTIREAEDDSE